MEYGSSGEGGHYFGLDIMSKSYGGESVTRGRHTGQLQISKVTRGAKNMTHPGNRDFFFLDYFLMRYDVILILFFTKSDSEFGK